MYVGRKYIYDNRLLLTLCRFTVYKHCGGYIKPKGRYLNISMASDTIASTASVSN